MEPADEQRALGMRTCGAIPTIKRRPCTLHLIFPQSQGMEGGVELHAVCGQPRSGILLTQPKSIDYSVCVSCSTTDS